MQHFCGDTPERGRNPMRIAIRAAILRPCRFPIDDRLAVAATQGLKLAGALYLDLQ